MVAAQSKSRSGEPDLSSGRIPEALRIIFIEAWQGKDVREPPKDNFAFKSFEKGVPIEDDGHDEGFVPKDSPRADKKKPESSVKSQLSRIQRTMSFRMPKNPALVRSSKSEELTRASGHLSTHLRETRRRSIEMGNGGLSDSEEVAPRSRSRSRPSSPRRGSRRRGVRPTKSAEDLSFMTESRSKTPRRGRRGSFEHDDQTSVTSVTSGTSRQSGSSRSSGGRRRGVRASRSEDLMAMAIPETSGHNASTVVETHESAAPSVPPPINAYPTQRSPQVFLDVMLRTRGYSTETFCTLETSYFNAPTQLQLASFHTRLQSLICYKTSASDEVKLRELLKCGISANACNHHGESLLHTACRNGYNSSVRIMLECGASAQVSDDSGRTPLHAAFFGTKPSYDIVEVLLQKDRHLLHLRDRLSSLPLSYIPRNQWGMWIDFFYSKRDELWPRRNKRFDGIAEPSPKMSERPHTTPLPNPPNALPHDMASMVASGKLTPEEALSLLEEDDDEEETDSQDLTSCSGTHAASIAAGLACSEFTWFDNVEAALLSEDEASDDEDEEDEDEEEEESDESEIRPEKKAAVAAPPAQQAANPQEGTTEQVPAIDIRKHLKDDDDFLVDVSEIMQGDGASVASEDSFA